MVNFLATMIGMALVDRKGRKFLLVMGTCGVVVAMTGVGLLFRVRREAAWIAAMQCRRWWGRGRT